MNEPMALLSIQVGDGTDEPAIKDLIAELAHSVHAAAAAHFGDRPGCHWRFFTRETAEADRSAFVEFLAAAAVPEPERGLYLSEFDEAHRPVAVAHWWVVEA